MRSLETSDYLPGNQHLNARAESVLATRYAQNAEHRLPFTCRPPDVGL
jgi:hypothetical protein